MAERPVPGPETRVERVADTVQQVASWLRAGGSGSVVSAVTRPGPGGLSSAKAPAVTRHAAIFTLMEDLRRIAEEEHNALAPQGTPVAPALVGAGRAASEEPEATRRPPSPPTGQWLNGPKLILVKGLHEGTAYPLHGGTSWVIGRGRDVAVNLPYDLYVSRHGAEVWQDGEEFYIEDLAPHKNGTYLNWRRLGAHEAASLRDGDVVSIGRSHLVFRSS